MPAHFHLERGEGLRALPSISFALRYCAGFCTQLLSPHAGRSDDRDDLKRQRREMQQPGPTAQVVPNKVAER
jgi:hypothetical protein